MGEHRWGPKGRPQQPPPYKTIPTEVPGFNPRVPPPQPIQLVPIWRAPAKRERGRQTFREPDFYLDPLAETPEERRVEAQRALQEHWTHRHGPQRSLASSQSPTSHRLDGAWSAPSSACCAPLIGSQPCGSATDAFTMSLSTTSSGRQTRADPTGIDVI